MKKQPVLKRAKPKVVDTGYKIKDSRFGIRKPFKNKEEPTSFSYSSPGRGASGEHQN